MSGGEMDSKMAMLLAEERETPSPEAARARVRDRLVTLGALDAPTPVHAPPSTSSTRIAGRSLAALLGAFSVGAVTGALIHAQLTGGRVAQRDAPPAVSAHAVEMAPPPSVEDVAPAPVPAASDSPKAPRLPSSAHAPGAAFAVGQLERERTMLDDVRGDLARGEAPTALGVLNRYATMFPKPLLGDEREALLIETLVKTGRFDEARMRAQAFRSRNPDSMFLPGIDSALKTIP